MLSARPVPCEPGCDAVISLTLHRPPGAARYRIAVVLLITAFILWIAIRTAVRAARGQIFPAPTVNCPRSSMMTENMTATEPGVVTKLSPLTVADTTSKLTGMIAAKGMKLFGVIDQAAEARQAGLTLRETVLVIFGSPAAGTPVMAASPLSALDLPLKVLVWSDDGQTKVSYYAPATLAARHHLGPELAGNLAGINGLTDALVAA